MGIQTQSLREYLREHADDLGVTSIAISPEEGARVLDIFEHTPSVLENGLNIALLTNDRGETIALALVDGDAETFWCLITKIWRHDA